MNKKPLKTIEINNATLKVVVSSTPASQSKGLMHIKGMHCDHGMLFEYEKEKPLTFWMKNTHIPLSIAFIDKNKNIFQIQEMQPHDETRISSSKPAKWALEVNKGWFKENDIKEGDQVHIPESRKINIKIVKLPLEAEELATKIEDTLSQMIAGAVKSKLGTSADLKDLYIDVQE